MRREMDERSEGMAVLRDMHREFMQSVSSHCWWKLTRGLKPEALDKNEKQISEEFNKLQAYYDGLPKERT